MRKKHLSASAEETQAVAHGLAQHLRRGGVIALTGELGAGKTVFVKGLARGLGITEIIQSPTFVLMKVYRVQHRAFDLLVHIDCYRVSNARELQDIGIEDYLRNPRALVVIEWAQKVRDLLAPYGALQVKLTSRSEHEREIVTQATHQSFLDGGYIDRRDTARGSRASGRSRY